MDTSFTRRRFIYQTGLATSVLYLGSRLGSAAKISPNEKLNLGVIGVGGRGGENLQGVSKENIVALCDIDDMRLEAAAQRFPAATKHNDFRRMLDQKDIDAVVISTPDHTHAVAAVAALQSGRHLYCEKPLSHTISEARIITDLARKQKRVTQLGTQIHAGSNYRRVVELIQAGTIGPVKEVHVWANATYGGVKLPAEAPPIPKHIHYDLWLGPVEPRPYSPEYVHFKWRNWWAFGGGALADFGCHFMDLPFWALGLKYPTAVEVIDGPPVDPESPPPWMVVRYEFPERKSQPPVRLTWYHGGKRPWFLSESLAAKWKSGVLFVGSKGQVLADYGKNVLLPEDKFADFKRPEPTLPKSIGHHEEWIRACKTDGTTSCPFDYSGPLSETALLGNVAYRVGRPLEWDAKKLRATNCPEAEQYIQHHYRSGWSL